MLIHARVALSTAQSALPSFSVPTVLTDTTLTARPAKSAQQIVRLARLYQIARAARTVIMFRELLVLSVLRTVQFAPQRSTALTVRTGTTTTTSCASNAHRTVCCALDCQCVLLVRQGTIFNCRTLALLVPTIAPSASPTPSASNAPMDTFLMTLNVCPVLRTAAFAQMSPLARLALLATTFNPAECANFVILSVRTAQPSARNAEDALLATTWSLRFAPNAPATAPRVQMLRLVQTARMGIIWLGLSVRNAIRAA